MNMQTAVFQTSEKKLSDAEIEARIFRRLEAARTAEQALERERVVLFQYPDTRTWFQKLRARWYLRQGEANTGYPVAPLEPAAEPVWPRHWAIVKYL